MARPERNNVDYFPFLCKEGKAMYYIEQKYGNDGYASWVKILRQLAVTNYHYLNLSDKIEFMFLSSKCKVSEEVLNSIINDLCELEEFDKTLWSENKILWSKKFTEHIKDAYLKRNNNCINYDGLLTLLNSLGIRKLSKLDSQVPDNTQSKVKKIKEDKFISQVVPTSDVDFEKFISAFNSIGKRNFKVTEKVKLALIARKKDYSNDEIWKAIKNAHLDKFHIDNDFKYLTPEFILRPDKLEKFLNQTSISNQGYSPQLTN